MTADAAQMDQVARELQELVVAWSRFQSIHDSSLVLAIRVVEGAALVRPKPVAVCIIGTPWENMGRQEVALLAVAQLNDVLVVRVAPLRHVPRPWLSFAPSAPPSPASVVFRCSDHEVSSAAVVGKRRA